MAEPTDYILAYDLDEGTGTAAGNSGSEGASWDMAESGTTTWVAGPGGGNTSTDDAVDMGGSGHYDTATGLTHPLSGNDVTMAVLARLDTDDIDQCLIQLGEFDDAVYIQPWGDEFLYAGWSKGGSFHEVSMDYDNIENDGLYHRYVLTIEDLVGLRKARLYFDGALQGTVFNGASLDTTMDRFIMGATTTGGADRLDGRIAAVRVYDRVLTSAEITDLFTGVATAYPDPGTIAVEGNDGELVEGDPPLPFPTDPLGILVEMQTDPAAGTWVDITSYVQRRDFISLSRGESAEASVGDPAMLSLILNNTDGRFSPRNPTGPYYGQIGRNTALRVSVRRGSISYPRFQGVVSAWPPRWDTWGNDVYVTLQAAGELRRLQQGTSPRQSTMRRGLEALPTAVAYWPMEDPEDATTLAAAFGGEPLDTELAETDFAASSLFESSDALPTLDAGELFGQVLNYDASPGATTVLFLLAIPTGGMDASVQSILQLYGSGSIRRWDVAWTSANSGSLRIDFDDDEFNTILESPELAAEVNGTEMLVAATLRTSGSNVKYSLAVIKVGQEGSTSLSGTLTGESMYRVSRVKWNNDGGMAGSTAGHLALLNSTIAISSLAAELKAYSGETAGRRIERLCAEADLTFTALGDLDATPLVGGQRVLTLVELLREAAAVDGGLLFEPRDSDGLAYRTLDSIYNQDAAVTLNYPDGELAPDLEPTEDDDAIRNDITVQRAGGSAYRAVKETGPLSILDPPSGVGRYDTVEDVNVAGPGQLPDQAGWRLHLGTVDEARFPLITVNLASNALIDDAALTAAVMNADVGDVIEITNPPAWMPPESIRQLVIGYTEEIANYEHVIRFNCRPASAFDVGTYDTDRYDTAASTLNEDLTTTETSVEVNTDSGPLWTTDSGDMPFPLWVGGEKVTVTAVTGTANPQTMTWTRSVNGVVKEHTTGDEIRLWTPCRRALS